VRLRLHIERLVLDGLPLGPGDAERVRAAAQRELARLLASPALSARLRAGGAIPSLPGAPLPATARSPAELGRDVARSVHGGLSR
jgi:hypothetical protein